MNVTYKPLLPQILEEAAERLGELGAVRAIPHLIEAVEFTLSLSGQDWRIDESTSRLMTTGPGGRPTAPEPRATATYHAA